MDEQDERLFLPRQAAEAYQATERATAPPGRLAALLYDAAIRLCRQAIEAFDDDDLALAAERLVRARWTVRRLQTRLETGDGQPIAENLAGTYAEVHRRLIEADFYRSRRAIEQTISMLLERRDAWKTFLDSAASPSARDSRRDVGQWVG